MPTGTAGNAAETAADEAFVGVAVVVPVAAATTRAVFVADLCHRLHAIVPPPTTAADMDSTFRPAASPLTAAASAPCFMT